MSIIGNNEVGYDECLCECYMSIGNNEVGYDECLCECYMIIGNNEVGYMMNVYVNVT
jgi:hypothetical protein